MVCAWATARRYDMRRKGEREKGREGGREEKRQEQEELTACLAQVSVMEGSEIKCEHAIVPGNVSSDAKMVLSKGITLEEELCSPRDLSR